MSELSLYMPHRIKPYILVICVIEIIFLLLLVKSFVLSIIFVSLIAGTIFLFIYPEFSLAVALTGNVLLAMIFDSIKSNIPAPVIVVYILLLGSSVIFVLFQQRPGRNIQFGKLIYLTIAIWFLLIFALRHSADRGYGIEKVAFFFLFNIILLSIPLLFREKIEKIRNLFIFAFFLGLLLGLITTYIALGAPSYERFRPSESINPIWLARSLGVSVLAGMFLLIRVRKKMLKILIVFSLVFFVYPILETGSRAPFLGLVGSLLLIFLLQPTQPISQKIKITLTATVLAIGYLFISSSTVSARISDPNATDVFSAVSRFAAWAQAFTDFLSSPLFGIGTGSFKFDMFWLSLIYPHNLFLEIACETGIVGLILIILFVTIAIKYGLHNIKLYHRINNDLGTQLSIISIAIFIFALWNSMFSGDIPHNEIIWFGAGLIWVLRISAQSRLVEIMKDNNS